MAIWVPQGSGTTTIYSGSSGIQSVVSSGCLGGYGVPDSPLYIEIDPDGMVTCGDNGLTAVVTTSGCIEGTGTTNYPIYVKLDPTGNIVCGANGLAVDLPEYLAASTSGIIYGDGTPDSPLYITITTASGVDGDGSVSDPLRVQLSPTGNIVYSADGLSIDLPTFLAVTTSGAISGDGSSGDPITLILSSTGNLVYGVDGLSCTLEQGLITVTTSGCVQGDGTANNPITVTLDPTGNIECRDNGLVCTLTPTAATTVSTSGCVGGDGSVGDPIYLKLDPTGNITCGANGLISTASIDSININPAYGTILSYDESTPVTLVASTPEQIVDFATNGRWQNVVVDSINGYIQVDASGDFWVHFSCSFMGVQNGDYEFTIYAGPAGSESATDTIGKITHVGGASDLTTISFSDIINLSENDRVEVYVTSDQTSFTPVHMRLAIHKLSSYIN